MRKTSAESETYARIKRAIILKKLLPGQQITEEWLAQNLNISRTPVRGALHALAREGLVTTIHNKGTFISKPTQKEIEHVYMVRIQLESYAARLAASSISEEQLQEMKYLNLKEKEAYETKNFEEYININTRIHVLPAISTQNQCLVKYVSELVSWGNCYVILKDPFYTTPLDKIMSISDHKSIIESLEKRDADLAEETVKSHLLSLIELHSNDIGFSPFD